MLLLAMLSTTQQFLFHFRRIILRHPSWRVSMLLLWLYKIFKDQVSAVQPHLQPSSLNKQPFKIPEAFLELRACGPMTHNLFSWSLPLYAIIEFNTFKDCRKNIIESVLTLNKHSESTYDLCCTSLSNTLLVIRLLVVGLLFWHLVCICLVVHGMKQWRCCSCQIFGKFLLLVQCVSRYTGFWIFWYTCWRGSL